MFAFMGAVDDLAETGEFVDGHGLAEPARTRFVHVGDDDRPVIADGPYGETQELLAGFRVLGCDNLERVTEIAARMRCPAPDGAPVHPVVIRPVLDGGGDV